jgi:hypothetical protein
VCHQLSAESERVIEPAAQARIARQGLHGLVAAALTTVSTNRQYGAA